MINNHENPVASNLEEQGMRVAGGHKLEFLGACGISLEGGRAGHCGGGTWVHMFLARWRSGWEVQLFGWATAVHVDPVE